MQSEIDSLKAQVAGVDVLKEQLAFLMQVAKANGVNNLSKKFFLSSLSSLK
jgi:hypothetical protein